MPQNTLNHSLNICSMLNINRISFSGLSPEFQAFIYHALFILTSFSGHKNKGLKESQGLGTLWPVSSVQSPRAYLRNVKQRHLRDLNPYRHCLLALCLFSIIRGSESIPQFQKGGPMDIQLSSQCRMRTQRFPAWT